MRQPGPAAEDRRDETARKQRVASSFDGAGEIRQRWTEHAAIGGIIERHRAVAFDEDEIDVLALEPRQLAGQGLRRLKRSGVTPIEAVKNAESTPGGDALLAGGARGRVVDRLCEGRSDHREADCPYK